MELASEQQPFKSELRFGSALLEWGLRAREPVSPLERSFQERIENPIRRVGRRLVGAKDRADLDVRMDQVILEGHVQRLLADLLAWKGIDQINKEVEAGLRGSELTKRLLEHYGQAVATIIEEGCHYTLAALAVPTPQIDVDALEYMRQHPFAFLTEMTVAPEVSEISLAGLEGDAAILALAFATHARKEVEDWLLTALAQRWTHGQRQRLRWLASVPGAQVPPTLIPPEERLDLRELDERARALSDQLKGKLAAARGREDA
jgi:hypothetical protein